MNIKAKYWQLIQRFPLRPIKTEKEADVATEIYTELSMKGNRTRDENDYLDVLTQLVMEYESKDARVKALLAEARSIPPQEILRSILEDNGMTQAQLAREIGVYQENISAFLKGRRELSKATAIKLAKRFACSVDLFMPRLNERLAS